MACGLLVLAVVPLIGVILLFSGPGISPLPFSSSDWRSGTPDLRGQMVDDLLANHELVGLTRSEVCALLGEPDSGGDTMFYRLGYMGRRKDVPFSFPYRLIIQLEQGVVCQVSIDD